MALAVAQSGADVSSDLGLQPVPDPPPLPAQNTQAAELEPEVTIIQGEQKTIQEYRVNGQLYMVKITPNRGVPYYMVDTDGDGDLETRRSELEENAIPQWILLKW